MSELNPGSHEVQIYTAGGFRWSGAIYHGAHRRLSDFINDPSAPFLTLEKVTLSTFSKGATRDLTVLDTVAITKRNVIAVVSGPESQPPRRNAEEYVVKVPQRMMVYAPPFAFIGNLHFSRNANWAEALNSWKTDFLILTEATIWSSDSNAVLNKNAGFLLASRLWTVAIHPQGQPEAEQAPRAPVIQKASWTRLRDINQADASPKENKKS